jgi:hypothetical protein
MLWKKPVNEPATGINITVGHRPLAEQNADMAVYWLLCTDICLIHLNISSFIVANRFNKICNL